MSETITQEGAEPIEGHATAAGSAGEQTTGSDEGGKTDERRFTQAEVDKLIAARLAEEKARLSKKLEKELAAKLEAKDADLEKTVQERLEALLKERELASAKESIAKELGLNEKQMAVLAGETPDELRAAAEELFGSIRKQAPVVPTGSTEGAQPTPGVFYRSQLKDFAFQQKYREEIARAKAEGRIIDDLSN